MCGSVIHRSIFPDGGLLAYAMPPVTAGMMGPSPIMIVMNFAGGADLNAMSPIYGGWFKDVNPTLAYTTANSIPLTSDQGIHPNMPILKTLWDQGAFSIVNMVGMGDTGGPKYTRAHDLDTDIKLSGYLMDSATSGGWAPRLTAQISSSLGGICMADQSLVTHGDTNPPRAIDGLTGGEGGFGGDYYTIMRDNLIVDEDPALNPSHKSVQDSMNAYAIAAKSLANLSGANLDTLNPAANFGNGGLANNFRDIVKIINANVGAQFFFVQQGGYDTHSGAKQGVINNLNEVNTALSAFVAYAKHYGFWNRVMILTLSEFGRTMENGNLGNDHGFSNAMWVMGGGINGGRIIAPVPTQADLGGGSYVKNYWVDFRAVFKEAIAAMGYNPDLVFPMTFPNSAYTPTGIFS